MAAASSEDEARRYFAVVGTEEIAENEFNLNLPRYVDTFEPEKVIPLGTAIRLLDEAAANSKESFDALQHALKHLSATSAES